MVIEFLLGNVSARQDFLHRCGLHGLMLALSAGGGEKGSRKFPLLVDPADWTICITSVSRLIEKGSSLELSAILNTILEALRRECVMDNERTLARSPLLDLALEALSACRRKWEVAGWGITPRDLRAYYQISEFVSPLPVPPDATPSWDSHWAEAKDEIERFDESAVEFSLYDIDAWLELCLVVIEFEPRFARQVKLPRDYESSIQSFLSSLKDRAESQPDLDTLDDCDEELDRLRYIERVAEKASLVFGTLEELTNDIIGTADAMADSVREQKGALERDAEDQAQEYVRDDEDEVNSHTVVNKPARTVYLTKPPDVNLSVSDLFEDL